MYRSTRPWPERTILGAAAVLLAGAIVAPTAAAAPTVTGTADLQPSHRGAVHENFEQGDCPESGWGWHFVLPGNASDIVSVTATFRDAGEVRYTATEPADKHAYVYTDGPDVLLDATAEVDGPATRVVLSHVCDGNPLAPLADELGISTATLEAANHDAAAHVAEQLGDFEPRGDLLAQLTNRRPMMRAALADRLGLTVTELAAASDRVMEDELVRAQSAGSLRGATATWFRHFHQEDCTSHISHAHVLDIVETVHIDEAEATGDITPELADEYRLLVDVIRRMNPEANLSY